MAGKTKTAPAVKAPARKSAPTLDQKIVELFLKTVGAECGLYNGGTRLFIPNLESHHLYQSNLEIVRDVLKSGRLAAGELEELIRERYKAGERQALLSAILPKSAEKRQLDENENLIEDGTVYQHSELYVRTAPSFFVSGNSMYSSSPGTQTAKERYTLGELLDYYYRRLPVAQLTSRRNRDLGGMRYLLDGYRVDEVLHAIDRAGGEEKPLSVLKLEDYLPEAREIVRDRAARKHG